MARIFADKTMQARISGLICPIRVLRDIRGLSSGRYQCPQEDQNAEPKQSATDYQKTHESDGMNPKETQNFHKQSEDQQNSGGSKPRPQAEFGIRLYSGFQNFTSFKWLTLCTVS